MNIVDEHLGMMFLVFFVAACVQLFLVRNKINNIVDPHVYFVLTSAFSLGLAMYAVDSVAMYVRIILYFCSFYLGFCGATRHSKLTTMPLELNRGRSQFRTVVVIGCLLFFCANLVVWVKSGIILFSADPSLQKSAAYSGGLGFIRRINWGLGIFVLIAAFYWWLLERSIWSRIWLCVALLTSIVGGGKGALLPIIFALGLYCLNPFKPWGREYQQFSVRRILLGVLLLGIVPVTVVLLTEAGSVQSAFNALVVRLFFFGDVLLYWGQPDIRTHFSQLGPIDYFRDSFGSILGMLRITDYVTPMGNQFVQFSLPPGTDFSEQLGPNLPFYVRGELYFGPWFASFYALAIGWIYGRVRLLFVRYRGRNALYYSLLAFAVCWSITLPTEEGLAIGKIVDFFLLFALVYVFVKLLHRIQVRSTSATL